MQLLKKIVEAVCICSIFAFGATEAFALTNSETEMHDEFYNALEKDDYSAAEGFYKTFTQFPTSKELHQKQIKLGYALINAYIQVKKFEDAYSILEKMAVFNEKDDMYEEYACSFLNLGIGYAKNGQLKEAEQLLQAMQPYSFHHIMQEH